MKTDSTTATYSQIPNNLQAVCSEDSTKGCLSMARREDESLRRTEHANVAVSWTGGKDSALALYETEALGCTVNCLVTFAPREPKFLAHPLAFMKLQAEALSLPHHVLTVEPPFERGYLKITIESILAAGIYIFCLRNATVVPS